jgi:hypothetical protein
VEGGLNGAVPAQNEERRPHGLSHKTHIAEPVVNPGGRVFQIFIQPKYDVFIEWIQKTFPLLIFSLLRISLILYVLLYCVSADPQLFRYLAMTQSFPLQKQ